MRGSQNFQHLLFLQYWTNVQQTEWGPELLSRVAKQLKRLDMVLTWLDRSWNDLTRCWHELTGCCKTWLGLEMTWPARFEMTCRSLDMTWNGLEMTCNGFTWLDRVLTDLTRSLRELTWLDTTWQNVSKNQLFRSKGFFAPDQKWCFQKVSTVDYWSWLETPVTDQSTGRSPFYSVSTPSKSTLVGYGGFEPTPIVHSWNFLKTPFLIRRAETLTSKKLVFGNILSSCVKPSQLT